MNKCITTKLKESVTGIGFFKSGELVFKLIATEPTWLWWLSQYSAVTTATLEGGAYFVAAENSIVSQGVTKQVAGDGVSIYVPKGEHYLKIDDKTKITALGTADFPNWNFKNFIDSTSPSFRIELYSETLKYATNLSYIGLTKPFYSFYELGSLFANKTILKAEITAKDALIGNFRDLFDNSGTVQTFELRNQTKITGDTSVLYGKQILEFTATGNTLDISLNDFYMIKGTILMLSGNLGKTRGNPLNINDDVAWVGLSGSTDVILDNENMFAPRTKVIAGEGLRFLESSAVDAFLILNAQRVAHPNLNSLPSWAKMIGIIGQRTNASDAAVSNLQSKGYTVTLAI